MRGLLGANTINALRYLDGEKTALKDSSPLLLRLFNFQNFQALIVL
jgi:hypothetical protein